MIKKWCLSLFLMLCLTMPSMASETANRPVRVAIIDTGSNTKYKEGISLVSASVSDDNGHGTLMARIIEESCPGVEFYIIKALDANGKTISPDLVTLGVDWAVSMNVDVINMSLRIRDSDALHAAIKKAYDKGIIIVAAAGNEASKLDTDTKDCASTSAAVCKLAYPAQYPEVIAIGMIDIESAAGESRRGKKITLLCKGHEGGKIGTSVSAAYAAGYAARMISENQKYDARKIEDVMTREVGKFDSHTSKTCVGTVPPLNDGQAEEGIVE